MSIITNYIHTVGWFILIPIGVIPLSIIIALKAKSDFDFEHWKDMDKRKLHNILLILICLLSWIYENNALYAVIRLVLMEPNEQQNEYAYIRVNDILKIKLLQEAPESITDLIANSPSGSLRNDIAKDLLKIIAIMEV